MYAAGRGRASGDTESHTSSGGSRRTTEKRLSLYDWSKLTIPSDPEAASMWLVINSSEDLEL